VAFNLTLNGGPGAHPQPRLQDRGQFPPLPGAGTDDQLVAAIAALAGHDRSTPTRSRRLDAQPVRLTAE
jgi:hypothetical protein